MKLNRTISSYWVVSVPIAIALTFSVVAGASSSPITPAAAYYLLGDTGNTGAANTTFTTPSSGDAWTFTATGSSATALIGRCPNGSACWGVQGNGTGIGVYGNAANSGNANGSIMGVEGTGGSTGANGTSYGGYFSASNGASGGKAYGIYGSGATAGIYAISAANGVYAKSTSASGNGVYASGSGSTFYGVWGDVGGGGFGMVGNSSGGIGVYGSSTGRASLGSPIAGVYGFNSLATLSGPSAINAGVFGTCANCNGVLGTSPNYIGVRGNATGAGNATYGGYFVANAGTGVYAHTTSGQTALRAVNTKKTAGFYAGIFDGNVLINGNYQVTGTKSAIVKTSDGSRLMYAEEATQSFFSDQGVAMLKNGRAVVKLDALFAQTVDLSKPYMVVVTPMSFESAGLGVGNQTAKSFEVRELNHGTGVYSFSWRVTALRKGYTKARMALVDDAGSVGPTTLPTHPSPNDTPVTDPSVAPPTVKAAPKFPRPAAAPTAK